MNDLIGSNFLLLQFPLPLSGEGQGEGPLCGAIAWCATHPNPAACQWHLPPGEVVARPRATGEGSGVGSNSISHLCVILERSEESRCPPLGHSLSVQGDANARHRASGLTSPVISRERRPTAPAVGSEGSASIAPRELPSNSLSLQFPLPLSGEGQGEGPGVARLSVAPHIRNPNKVKP
jgi:hypothetical protein